MKSFPLAFHQEGGQTGVGVHPTKLTLTFYPNPTLRPLGGLWAASSEHGNTVPYFR